MNRNLTVSVRSLLLAVIVLLALMVAYLLGSAGGGPTPANAADQPSQTDPEHRALTMTGTGSAVAVPDQLSFALGVTVKRVALDDALGAANATMSRVLARLGDDGVERSDVQTTGLSMYPEYQYHSDSPPTLTGYRVTEHASVLVKDLKQGGAAVSAAVDAGGNDVRVSDIRLLVGDADGVMKKARDAAVAEATAKAEQYAEASGQTLGDVVTLREVHTRALPTRRQAFASLRGAVADTAPLPIRAGKDKTSVTVRMVWALS